MNTNKEDIYSTRDLAEGALLLTKDQRLIRLDRQGKVVHFIFSNRRVCEELSNKFWFGECLVNAKSFYDAIQTLKNRIFSY